MIGLVWRAKRLGVGCSPAELAAYLGYLHGLDVSPSDVRAWESDDVDPPEVLGEVLAELAERRDMRPSGFLLIGSTFLRGGGGLLLLGLWRCATLTS